MQTISRRPQSEYLSDYEYIMTAKQSQKEALRSTAQFELYTKYLPLIRKQAHKFNLGPEDKEDFESEAFFCVRKVLDFVDEGGIDERFSFGYFLRFHLLNMGIQRVNKSKRRAARVGNPISYEAITYDGYTPSSLSLSEDDAFAETCERLDREIALRACDKLLVSDRDKTIARLAVKGLSTKEIAEQVDLSAQRVITLRKRLLDQLVDLLSKGGERSY